jgi:hypothetical protein
MQKLAQGIASAPGAQMAAQPQMMAAGGIVAFAGPDGSQVKGEGAEKKERWQDMKRRPDETPTEFLRRVEAAKQKDFQAQGPSKLIEFSLRRGATGP